MIEYIILALLIVQLGLTMKGTLKFPGNSSSKVIIDTSTLMDGRVIELIRTGFLSGNIYLADNVTTELQHMADGTSTLKRERARLGLDILREMQETKGVNVIFLASLDMDADDALRHYAKKMGAKLMTNDYNLEKVAITEELHVLSVNELAKNLRPVVIPGEKMSLKIVQKGAERGQGVGYLDDGTMIVVDDAAREVGNTVEIKTTRTLQTSAGKMCFGELVDKDKANRKNQRKKTDK